MKALESGALIYPESILNVTPGEFRTKALEIFRYQHSHCAVYRAFCDAMHVNPDKVTDVTGIPYLPISFFRSHRVTAGLTGEPDLVFESSGTTGEQTSRHFVASRQVYESSLVRGFTQFYGPPADYVILALLPSYLERPHASLVYMAKTLMERGGKADSGFYINEWDKLAEKLRQLEGSGTRTLLLGVTFALLDFAELHPMQLNGTIVMETGGMKGRREELTREQVHGQLKSRWGLKSVHSEYGMTELLSQAYAPANGVFSPSATMGVLVRDMNDPLEVSGTGTGALNIIDLANVYSCSFIATDDMGTVNADGTFTVTGRMDHTILRGCSQMVV